MRRRRLLLFFMAGAVVVVVFWLAWPSREPEYRGRKLSNWFIQVAYMDRYTGNRSRDEAYEAFSHIGTNGLHWAFEWIHYQPPPWKAALCAISSSWPEPIRFLEWPPERAEGAWLYLESLGPGAGSAIPELTRLLNDSTSPDDADRAARVLSSIGPEALPPLLALIKNPGASNRVALMHYASKVGQLGTNAIPLVAALVTCLSDPDEKIAAHAARLLGNLAKEPGKAVPALANALQNPSKWVRLEAALAIPRFGEQARPAVPALLRAISSGDDSMRRFATSALRQIAPEVLHEEEDGTGGNGGNRERKTE